MYDFTKMYSDGAHYIPTRMMKGIEQYYKKGVLPGGFLQKIITNDLSGCISQADDENMGNLPAYVRFFYNQCDSRCWGSKEAMEEWVGHNGLEGEIEALEEANSERDVFLFNEIYWGVDPTNNFKSASTQQLMEACGLIPTFIMEEAEDVVATALECYGFGGPEMTGGVVDDEGIYLYPEDPPLHPICKGVAGETLVYIYQFGIVAFITPEKTVVYRFD